MPEEEIAAAPSEENGNVQPDVPAEAPSEPNAEETPAPVEEPTLAPEPELVELPDGRKVDAATVAQEYRNLLSDYTRKSQELAAVKAPITDPKPTSPLDDPNYVPQTYAELAQQIKQETLREIEASKEAEVQARQAIEDTVANQLSELKTADPSLNENALFVHATKYGFRDLKLAHQNMKDMSETMKKVQKATADNINKRSDPVSVSPGANGSRSDPSQFSTSVEYLRSLK